MPPDKNGLERATGLVGVSPRRSDRSAINSKQHGSHTAGNDSCDGSVYVARAGKGLSVDKRTDIWALGAVLYELLTGKLAFQAQDVSETLAAILMKEPDWGAIASAPPAVTTTIQQCLQKDQKQRIRVRLSGADGRFRN